MKKLIIASLLMAAPAFAAEERVEHCALGFNGAMATVDTVLSKRPQTMEVQKLRRFVQLVVQMDVATKGCTELFKQMDEQNGK